MSTPSVFIIGLDHSMQGYDLEQSNEAEKRLEYSVKEQTYSYVEKSIKDLGIMFIGEECHTGKKTIARVLAQELGCHYAEIDMPMEQRREAGIPDDYEKQGGAVRSRGFDIRERHMISTTYSACSLTGPKLIVVGAEHIPGLKEKFASRGETVDAKDLRTEPWYRTILDAFLAGELN